MAPTSAPGPVDDFSTSPWLTHLARPAVRRERALRPDPPDELLSWPLVSVDDHLFEPPDTFSDRLPRKYRDQAPRVVEDADGLQYWQVEDLQLPITGANASVGWSREDFTIGLVRFDEVRRATWDVHERVRDMDRCGMAASLCFPSVVFGFSGRKFMELEDTGLGLACARAYNDWLLEAWSGAYPERLISTQVPWLLDVDEGVAEIHRNAARGARSVTFSENPQKVGLPSIHTRHWDPLFAACQETETVINLHVGSSSETMIPSTDSPLETIALLFQVSSMATAADWLYSQIPVRFPNLKIVLSEGGIGWVPAFLDRLEYTLDRYAEDGDGGANRTWRAPETPADVFMRNFWFTAIDDPTTFKTVQDYPSHWQDHFVTEVDYPHLDSSWPHAQDTLRHQLDGLSPELAERFAYGNACDLYGLDRTAVRDLFPKERYVG